MRKYSIVGGRGGEDGLTEPTAKTWAFRARTRTRRRLLTVKGNPVREAEVGAMLSTGCVPPHQGREACFGTGGRIDRHRQTFI